MRSMHQARERAREERERVGFDSADLLNRLVRYMESVYRIDFVSMTPAQMRGSDAEVDGDRILRFNNTLADDERLVVFAHELGHIVLHKRLLSRDVVVDDIVASEYGDAGPAAIARYSPRVREEAEARAFALEFLCSSAVVFAEWRASEGGTTFERLARSFGVDVSIVRTQLASALHDTATGAERMASATYREVTFNDEQVKAARHLGGPALVDAGPGTGKTATVIRRLEFAIEELEAAPDQVLVLTFSNEAVQDLYQRIEYRFGVESAGRMTISTFHGFGMEMLRWHHEHAGLPESFSLLDEDGQIELLLELLGKVPCPAMNPIPNPGDVARRVVKYINHLKHRRITADGLERALDPWRPQGVGGDNPAAGRELLALYREYENEKQDRGAVDMADLILLPLRLLEGDQRIQAAYIEKYHWILVDEFQDVTRATSDLLRAIAGGKRDPWVVGDARQAIYQFLGAAPANVREFESNFPGSHTYRLRENHRAAPLIVSAANQLASLFPEEGPTNRWIAVAGEVPFGDTPVVVAEAASDHAEAQGVADQIVEWRHAGVEGGDIAVLARRHVDVRSVVLALTARGIKADSSGLLTAEGAAGDLAAVLTLASRRPAASLPRLTVALGRGRYSPEEINATIRYLLRVERAKATTDSEEAPDLDPERSVSHGLLAEVAKARAHAEDEHFRADGFDCLMTFLFEGSEYLRRVLAAPDTAERSMILMEIVSTLSLATAYRVTHPGGEGSGQRYRRRYGFAERLRMSLTETVPIPISPTPRRDAVRVMTCHASKGLEFPCVIVAGQTMPKMKETWSWIPAECRPDPAEETEQADALLFVGVTRAKRAVVVSYPAKATDSERSPPKKVVSLLEKWRATFDVPSKHWRAPGGSTAVATMGPLWGDPLGDGETEGRPYLKPSALSAQLCPIRFYMEEVLGLRFQEALRALYPAWFDAVRKSLRVCATRSFTSSISQDESSVVFDDLFSEVTLGEHPHFEMYREAGQQIVRGFAAAFQPTREATYLDSEFEIAPAGLGKPVRLDLVARFRDAEGTEVAVGFRPESKQGAVNKNGVLAWSKLGSAQIPFVLLWMNNPSSAGRVFSGADGTLYPIAWNSGKRGMDGEVEGVMTRHAALVSGDYSHQIEEYQCERRCSMRVTCPYWMKVLPP